MGHHPSAVGTEQIQSVGSGISPATWFIIIGVVIIGAIIGYIVKGGSKK